jgi:hypothetical protein
MIRLTFLGGGAPLSVPHNLSVSHGSHGGMGNEGRKRVRNLGYSTVYVSTVIAPAKAHLVQFGRRGEFCPLRYYRTLTILSTSFDDIEINGQQWDHSPP